MSVVGLDVGTSRVKAVRFDSSWRAVDSAVEDTTVLAAPGGRREQDMSEVWAACRRVVGAVSERAGDVELLAVTAQGDGTWLVDGAGEPVGTALLWNDARAAGLVRTWRDDGTLERAFRINGSLGAPGLASAQLRWLVEHEPDRVAAADRLLSCGSWVFARLTGRSVLERSEAVNPFGDVTAGEYDERLLSLFGLAEVRRLLPELVSLGEGVAPLTAPDLGLPRGTPVALAPYDVPATAIGAGAAADGAAFAVLGTTLCVGAVASDPRLDRAASGMTLPFGPHGRWLLAYATLTGTEALDWAARLLGVADAAAVVGLAESATRTDPPLFAPYLSPAGERAPFLDPSVRGALSGLDLDHTPADVARGVVEGLTLAVVDCLAAAGPPARHLSLSGGGARSAWWSQLLADATGLTVSRPVSEEVGALGAALHGATAVGRYADLTDAVAAGVESGERLVPRPAETARLHERYAALLAARSTR